MIRSIQFFGFIALFPSLFLSDVAQGDEDRITHYLEKVIEYTPDDNSEDFVRVAFLHACHGNWEAAFDLSKQLENKFRRRSLRTLISQIAILSGQTRWLEEHQIPITWESGLIHGARAVFFAREGNAQQAIEFAEKIKSPEYSHKIFCEVTRQLCLAGQQEAAREAFMRALNQMEARSSRELLQAALALRYRPLIIEMYQRLVKQENLINIPPLDLLAQVAASGFLVESEELSDSFGELSLTRLPGKMWDAADQDPAKKNYDRLMAIAGDPNDARLKDASAQFRLFYSRLASGDVQSAEAFANSRTPPTTRLSALVEVSHVYAKNEDFESSSRVLNSAQELLEKLYLGHDAESDKKKIYENTEHVRYFSKIGALRILNGDVKVGEQLLEKAATIASADPPGNQKSYPLAPLISQIDAHLICDRPIEARDILMQAFKSGQISERVTPLIEFQLQPLVDAIVAQGGHQEALKILHVLKSRSPRVTIIKLTAQAQLRHDGPDADIDWVLPHRKDVPVEELFLSVAEEELAEKSEELNALLHSVAPLAQQILFAF